LLRKFFNQFKNHCALFGVDRDGRAGLLVRQRGRFDHLLLKRGYVLIPGDQFDDSRARRATFDDRPAAVVGVDSFFDFGGDQRGERFNRFLLHTRTLARIESPIDEAPRGHDVNAGLLGGLCQHLGVAARGRRGHVDNRAAAERFEIVHFFNGFVGAGQKKVLAGVNQRAAGSDHMCMRVRGAEVRCADAPQDSLYFSIQRLIGHAGLLERDS